MPQIWASNLFFSLPRSHKNKSRFTAKKNLGFLDHTGMFKKKNRPFCKVNLGHFGSYKRKSHIIAINQLGNYKKRRSSIKTRLRKSFRDLFFVTLKLWFWTSLKTHKLRITQCFFSFFLFFRDCGFYTAQANTKQISIWTSTLVNQILNISMFEVFSRNTVSKLTVCLAAS